MSSMASANWDSLGKVDADGLRAMISTCRMDLDTFREEAVRGGMRETAGRLEARLEDVVQRLECATEALSRLPDTIGAASPALLPAEVLAREADHRIKNSLQTVTALLQRQAFKAESEAVRDALAAASARVSAIAQVHTSLHAAQGPYGLSLDLDLVAYLTGLCTTLGESLGIDGDRRRLLLEMDPAVVSPATAQSVGLVVVELATNALRHAFEPGRRGTVRVTGTKDAQGSYTLSIEDDGRGLPQGFDIRLRPTGLGLRLVSVLADQLRAKLSIDGSRGARFTLLLPPTVARSTDRAGTVPSA